MKKLAKGFDEWAKSATCPTGGTAAWQRWPKAFIAECDEVMKRNDAGTTSVGASAMAARGRAAYGVDATLDKIHSYARARGRKSWRNP